MVKSSKSQHLEEDDEAYEELVNRNNSSSCRDEMMKVEGKSSEQKANTHRSKHSETEQRRRSKINERFQILRDIIPQNDQKRDKASFLLEVIEYIQFLQEKLQLYEGSYQGWSQELTKLTPWRSHNGPADSHMDHSQVLRNGSSHDNSVVTPSMLTNAQDSMESNFGTAALYKAMDLPPGSTAPMVSPSMVSPNPHAQSNMFAPLAKDGLSFQTLQDSVSDAENMGYQPQSQLWQGKQSTAECSAPNSALNEQEFAVENGSSTSNAYSQGVLSTLTQMLQSSGVDLSQTSISVQIDVGKQLSSGETAMASSSKDNEKQYQNNQGISQAGARSRNEDSEHPHKRIRTEQI